MYQVAHVNGEYTCVDSKNYKQKLFIFYSRNGDIMKVVLANNSNTLFSTPLIFGLCFKNYLESAKEMEQHIEFEYARPDISLYVDTVSFGKYSHTLALSDTANKFKTFLFHDTLLIRSNKNDELFDGLYTEYHQNGMPKLVGYYEQENIYSSPDRVGLWQTRYDDGKVESEGLYGKTVEKALPQERIKYHGKKSGVFPIYQQYQTEYYYPKKGEWTYYSRDGKIIKKETYNKDGVLVQTEKFE
jgi:hypothetical protein